MTNELFGVNCDADGCTKSIELADTEHIESTDTVDTDYDGWFIGVRTLDDQPGVLMIDTATCPEHTVEEDTEAVVQ